jgi:hypothetical protein
MCNNTSPFSLYSTIAVLFHCFRRVPTYPKMQLFNGKSPAEVRSVKILKTLAILPIRCFHFGRLGLLPKHSRNLPHSTNQKYICFYFTEAITSVASMPLLFIQLLMIYDKGSSGILWTWNPYLRKKDVQIPRWWIGGVLSMGRGLSC